MTAAQQAEVLQVAVVGAGLAAGWGLLWAANRRARRHWDDAFNATRTDHHDTNPNGTP